MHGSFLNKKWKVKEWLEVSKVNMPTIDKVGKLSTICAGLVGGTRDGYKHTKLRVSKKECDYDVLKNKGRQSSGI